MYNWCVRINYKPTGHQCRDNQDTQHSIPQGSSLGIFSSHTHLPPTLFPHLWLLKTHFHFCKSLLLKTLNSQQAFCPSLLSTGIMGPSYHHQPIWLSRCFFSACLKVKWMVHLTMNFVCGGSWVASFIFPRRCLIVQHHVPAMTSLLHLYQALC